MPATVASILSAARAEWDTWGRSDWNLVAGTKHIVHTDDEPAFARYVVDNYCAVGGGAPSLDDISDDRYFWSAVGMSAIMKNSGFARSEFPFAQSHSKFIRYFVAARKSEDRSAAFWAFRLGEQGGKPEPGDLVAYARAKGMTPEKAAKLFDATRDYESHSDVVVAKRAAEIDVIGCNVMDSVTRKTLRIDASGDLLDDQHSWFAVLKRRQI